MKKYLNQPDEIVEGETLRRAFSGSVIKGIDKEKRQVEFIISTAAVDRYGDIIEVNGWDLKTYKNNPVVLFGHMSSLPPIGRAIKTWKDGDALRSIAEFMPADLSAFAYSIFRMYEEKFLNAVSVGFRPLKYERLKDEDGNETWSYRFMKQELLEFSAVPIPANPEALIAARQKGIDTSPIKQWAEEMLDRWNETANPLQSLYGVDRKHMEAVRRRAAGAGMSIRVSPEVQDQLMKRNLEAIRKAKAAKEPRLETISIKGVEFAVPVVEKSGLKLGEVLISTDEVNGVRTHHIDKADASALFTKELIEDEITGIITLELRDGADGEKEPVVTIKGDNESPEYTILGVTEDGTLYGMKSSVVAEADAGEQTEGTETTEAEAGAETEGEAEGEKGKKKPKPEDDDDADEPEDDEEDEEDEKASETSETKTQEQPEAKSVDEDNEPLPLNVHLMLIEDQLVNLEETLDKQAATAGKRELRKMGFLAGYFRELADRLDGGVKTDKSVPPSTATLPAKVEEQKEVNSLTSDEANVYIKNVLGQLQPLLTDMIASKISKLKGRLD